MGDKFLWYDWHTGRVVSLPIRNCRELMIGGDRRLTSWCVCVFTAVLTVILTESTWIVDQKRKEAHKVAVALKMVAAADKDLKNDNCEPHVMPDSP